MHLVERFTLQISRDLKYDGAFCVPFVSCGVILDSAHSNRPAAIYKDLQSAFHCLHGHSIMHTYAPLHQNPSLLCASCHFYTIF